jgi:hypothetical protein
MFEPIVQLQQLRSRFLLMRAVCLRSAPYDVRAGYFRDAALLAWRASRLIGGWLNGHPNSQFHPRDTRFAKLALHTHAALIGLLHGNARRRTVWLHEQLDVLAQACADIRAVTSSVAINDILGRRQPEIAALQRVTAAAAPIAAPMPRKSVAGSMRGDETAWPFLSI